MKLKCSGPMKMFVGGFVASLTMASFAYTSRMESHSVSASLALEMREIAIQSDGLEDPTLPTLHSLRRARNSLLERSRRTSPSERRVRDSAAGFSATPAFASQQALANRQTGGGGNQCRLRVLKQLGWQVRPESGRDRVTVSGGNPCDDSSIEASRKAGELQIYLPENLQSMDPEQLKTALNEAIYSEASVCAYKFKAGAAAKSAAIALIQNPNFTFFFTQPIVQFYGNRILWSQGCYNSAGIPQCFRPKSGASPSAALRHFTEGTVSTECALGLQVAEHETQRRIYGESFDQVFSAEEILIGDMSVVTDTSNASWGRWSETDTLWDQFGEKAAQMGPRWLEGLSGYIGNVYGYENPGQHNPYLDEPNDQGENFLITEVSDAAFQQLKEHGSLEYLNRKNFELWELSQGLSDKAKAVAGGNTPLENYPALQLERHAALKEKIQKMRAILDEPIYNGIKVYVHDLKIMTLRQHVARLLRVNPRVAYMVDLYPSRVNSGFFRRYVKHLVAGCAQ